MKTIKNRLQNIEKLYIENPKTAFSGKEASKIDELITDGYLQNDRFIHIVAFGGINEYYFNGMGNPLTEKGRIEVHKKWYKQLFVFIKNNIFNLLKT